MENNRKLMFTNAYFGKPYFNRRGEKVIYLHSRDYPQTENNEAFSVVSVVKEDIAIDSGKKYIIDYVVNEYGEFNTLSHKQHGDDVVREYWEEVDDNFINKKTDAASVGLIEGTDDWRIFRIGFKWGFREGLNYCGGKDDE